jgi:hypothetical protein
VVQDHLGRMVVSVIGAHAVCEVRCAGVFGVLFARGMPG